MWGDGAAELDVQREATRQGTPVWGSCRGLSQDDGTGASVRTGRNSCCRVMTQGTPVWDNLVGRDGGGDPKVRQWDRRTKWDHQWKRDCRVGQL